MGGFHVTVRIVRRPNKLQCGCRESLVDRLASSAGVASVLCGMEPLAKGHLWCSPLVVFQHTLSEQQVQVPLVIPGVSWPDASTMGAL